MVLAFMMMMSDGSKEIYQDHPSQKVMSNQALLNSGFGDDDDDPRPGESYSDWKMDRATRILYDLHLGYFLYRFCYPFNFSQNIDKFRITF